MFGSFRVILMKELLTKSTKQPLSMKIMSYEFTNDDITFFLLYSGLFLRFRCVENEFNLNRIQKI